MPSKISSELKLTATFPIKFRVPGCEDLESTDVTAEIRFTVTLDAPCTHPQPEGNKQTYDDVRLSEFTILKDGGLDLSAAQWSDEVEEWLYDDGYDEACALARSGQGA
jgi:hypothetical protein